jgi:DnaJ-domain-containing protein 1
MAEVFIYRPKFVDIRIKKPRAGEAEAAPEERACDQIGCRRAGSCKAPKSREQVNAFWWFCPEHAAEYNRRWNYFEGMSEDELRDFSASERAGHRPTWSFRAASGDRLSAAYRNHANGKRADPFGVFRNDGAEDAPKRERSVSRVQKLALEALGLEPNASGDEIRARYADLIKRYHPDSNGGDRSAETLLQKVIRAYQTLKNTGMV